LYLVQEASFSRYDATFETSNHSDWHKVNLRTLAFPCLQRNVENFLRTATLWSNVSCLLSPYRNQFKTDSLVNCLQYYRHQFSLPSLLRVLSLFLIIIIINIIVDLTFIVITIRDMFTTNSPYSTVTHAPVCSHMFALLYSIT
jgi:hypothetical protein